MHIITALLEGKNLNYAIDRAAVDASVRDRQPGVLLQWLATTNHDRQPDCLLSESPEKIKLQDNGQTKTSK